MTLPDALAEVLRLAAGVTQAKWGCVQWGASVKVEAVERTPGLPIVREVAMAQSNADAALIVGLVNFIRQHGSEIQAMADDARRLDWIDENGVAIRSRENGKRNALVWNYNEDGQQIKLRAAIDALNPIAKESP